MEQVSVYYSSVDDVYVIVFEDEIIFPDPVPEGPASRNSRGDGRWEMFTHGVCAQAHNSGYYMKQLAITGRHLPEPVEPQDFAWKLQRAADKLEGMANVTLEYPGLSPLGRERASQDQYAADMLRTHHQELVSALMALYRERPRVVEEDGHL